MLSNASSFPRLFASHLCFIFWLCSQWVEICFHWPGSGVPRWFTPLVSPRSWGWAGVLEVARVHGVGLGSGQGSWTAGFGHTRHGQLRLQKNETLRNEHKGYEALRMVVQMRGMQSPRWSATEQCTSGWIAVSASAHAPKTINSSSSSSYTFKTFIILRLINSNKFWSKTPFYSLCRYQLLRWSSE